MDKQRHRLSASLNWFAAIWLVGWALYVTFWSKFALTTEGTMNQVAVLLIPAALAFAASWALDRYVAPDRGDIRAGLPD